MNALPVVAGREIGAGLRNRWAAAATLMLAGLALALVLLGGAPAGPAAASRLAVATVNLASLTVYLVPLLALLLSYDALAGETERGTMQLLLACPVARWQVLVGKFLAHLAVLAFAVAAGYGVAGALAAGGADAAAWRAFGVMAGSSVWLGAVFAALGYAIGAAVRDRSTAGAAAVAAWFVFVVLYDMALLGMLAADEGQAVAPGLFEALMLANPTDLYRMVNSGDTGLAGLAEFGAGSVPAAMAAWVAAPLAAAGALFYRREY